MSSSGTESAGAILAKAREKEALVDLIWTACSNVATISGAPQGGLGKIMKMHKIAKVPSESSNNVLSLETEIS